MGKLPEDVLLFQSLHQSALILVRHQEAALGIRTDAERVHHMGHGDFGAHSVPEVGAVLVRGTARPVLRSASQGPGREGAGGGLGQLGVHRLLPLQTGDLLSQISDVLLHAGVGGVILGGQDAFLVAVAVQESLCSLPCLGPFLSQFQNGHDVFLLKISTN